MDTHWKVITPIGIVALAALIHQGFDSQDGTASSTPAPLTPSSSQQLQQASHLTGSGHEVTNSPDSATTKAAPSNDKHVRKSKKMTQRHTAKNEQRVVKPISMATRALDSNIDPLLELNQELTPRVEHLPKKLHLPPGQQHQIQVKFVDSAQARVDENNQISLRWSEDAALQSLLTLLSKHGVSATPTFSAAEDITELRMKAAKRSGNMQADLNGTMQFSSTTSGNDLLAFANLMQHSPLIESVDIISLDMPPPPPVDITPTTSDYSSQQRYLDSDPGFGVRSIWALGITGKGVRFTDCEYGYNPNHEDLEDSGITDISNGAINQEVYSRGWDEHGTAAMGVSVAGNNGYGVTGMAYDCDAYFASEWTVNGYSRTTAVSQAVSNSSAGDVILLEMQATGALGDFGPAEYQSSIWNLTRTATDAGIIVVAAAGNGAENLDHADYASYRSRGDSGAIIVGAGNDTTSHARLSYSTYGARVDVQAWGTRVLTTGYGSFAQPGGDENQNYSYFSGTSSASACAAGVVVLMQSYAKNVLNTTFTPAEMRSHLKAYGNAQDSSAEPIGPGLALNLATPQLPSAPLNFSASKLNQSSIKLEFNGLPFRTYKIEYSSNLNDWFDLQTDLPGAATTQSIDLTNELNSFGHRFYQMTQTN